MSQDMAQQPHTPTTYSRSQLRRIAALADVVTTATTGRHGRVGIDLFGDGFVLHAERTGFSTVCYGVTDANGTPLAAGEVDPNSTPVGEAFADALAEATGRYVRLHADPSGITHEDTLSLAEPPR